MGRIRQKYIKRTAFEALEKHRDKFVPDFSKNKKALDEVVHIQGKFLRNKVAGYITRLAKRLPAQQR